MSDPRPAETLADLRGEIDRIDRAMHGLLMERGTIIDRIIAAKRRLGGGSAFHPGREAAMMRALAERHAGALPLDTVESIWRVIISTFTFIQMDYSVHADASAESAAESARMRDSARFHFGFTVPYLPRGGAADVIDAVAASYSDLGMLAVERIARTAMPWWAKLTPPQAPKVIARLPFVERPDHPAGLPVYVVAKPLAETAAREVVLYSASVERWREPIPAAVKALGGEVVDTAGERFGLSMLVAVPGEIAAGEVGRRLAEAGAGEPRLTEIGSHARRFQAPQASIEVTAAPQRRAAE